MQKVWKGLIAMHALFVMAGCGVMIPHDSVKHELSENYALADGVKCTSPEMIDGDINTAGETVRLEPDPMLSMLETWAFLKPSGNPYPVASPRRRGLSFNYSMAEVTLPEKRPIEKIVIYSEDLVKFSVSALAEKVLFVIDHSFQDDLENKAVSSDLREEFENNSIKLSNYAAISVEETGRRWLISDMNTFYVIKKEGDLKGGGEFNVYRREWELIKGIDNNTKKAVVIWTSVTTDTIRISVDDKKTAYGSSKTKVGASAGHALPRIQEIELYGARQETH
jgi:hypothetical protein